MLTRLLAFGIIEAWEHSGLLDCGGPSDFRAGKQSTVKQSFSVVSSWFPTLEMSPLALHTCLPHASLTPKQTCDPSSLSTHMFQPDLNSDRRQMRKQEQQQQEVRNVQLNRLDRSGCTAGEETRCLPSCC